MQDDLPKRKQLLIVDDDREFLSEVTASLKQSSQSRWSIRSTTNHSQAIELLKTQAVDTVVLDLEMPVMDGIEFLRLLRRSHPSQQVVMLANRVEEKSRQAAMDLGAALFLAKPTSEEGFQSLFAALDALAAAAPQSGFRGVMQRVGLEDVLQMECLARKSSILVVSTGKKKGQIFISEGEIIHAEFGALHGEMALYGLLALTGGEFNLEPFTEPARHTISGQYQFLLMEAARLRDESTPQSAPSGGNIGAGADYGGVDSTPVEARGIRIEEVLLCSGAGEVLYEWKCESIEKRLELFKAVEQQAMIAAKGTPSGRFHRVSQELGTSRLLVQIQPAFRLLVRSAMPVQESGSHE